jgi:hypothetical protein
MATANVPGPSNKNGFVPQCAPAYLPRSLIDFVLGSHKYRVRSRRRKARFRHSKFLERRIVMRLTTRLLSTLALVLGLAAPAVADPFFFTTGNPDGRMATASRPASAHKIEIESADDFILPSRTVLTGASFTGLLVHGGLDDDAIGEVRVEIYRVFPNDSDVSRTSGPPTFSTARVPTRKNSPADVELVDRSTAAGNLLFAVTVIDHHFLVANSVIDGIHPRPNQTTTGDGPVAGKMVQFDVVFSEPLDLPADHYFFVPQVELPGRQGNFLWLSAPHPQFTGDLQMWIRNSNLDPDWLRVGTDIVGGTTFNGSFSLIGETIP